MDGTVHCAKSHEYPGGIHIRRIHPFRHEQIKRERIEKHWNLEQVLQVVRWIGYCWWREPRKFTRHSEVLRTQLFGGDETDAADVHVYPHDERQKHHREKRAEDHCLFHCVLTVK